MKCEWDAQKNRTNIAKHGFDFSDAAEIFDLPMLVAPDTREDYAEQRFVGIGFLRQRIIVVVYAQQDDDTIRTISLRKALRHERERFGQFLRDELGAGRSDD
ncbi:MAG TPA: hypothetical protein DC054_24540 [Blastocatellia bacterium]|nr:hypothetical protein [Blastocatellia bacterium]